MQVLIFLTLVTPSRLYYSTELRAAAVGKQHGQTLETMEIMRCWSWMMMLAARPYYFVHAHILCLSTLTIVPFKMAGYPNRNYLCSKVNTPPQPYHVVSLTVSSFV